MLPSICQIIIVCAALGTAIAGYIHYANVKWKERLREDVGLRRDFILEPRLSSIQCMIEHPTSCEDLTSLLQKLVESEDPYSVDLTPTEMALHQELDNYVNFLEAIGSLRARSFLQKEDYSGFWSYYFGRIKEWDLLWQYVSNPAYEWDDVTKWAKEVAST